MYFGFVLVCLQNPRRNAEELYTAILPIFVAHIINSIMSIEILAALHDIYEFYTFKCISNILYFNGESLGTYSFTP